MRGVFFTPYDRHISSPRGEDSYEADSRDSLSNLQLLELHGSGHEIGSHGSVYQDLTVLSREVARNTILQSRIDLEILLNAPVQSFAFPFDRQDPELCEIVHQSGFKFCLESSYGDPLGPLCNRSCRLQLDKGRVRLILQLLTCISK